MRKILSKIAGAAAIALVLQAMASAEPMWEKKEGSPDMPFNFAASPEKAAMLEGSSEEERSRVLNGKIARLFDAETPRSDLV